MTNENNLSIDKYFKIDLGQNLKSVGFQSNSEDQARLKALASEAGLDVGEAVQLLLNMVEIVVLRGNDHHSIDKSLPLSKLERFVLTIALNAGLFTTEQLAMLIAVAEQSGIAQSSMRIDATLSIMKSNLDHQNHFFDE